MQLGETIATYDVGLALRGESGKFEITSPAGEVYDVTCKTNHSISNMEWSANTPSPQPYLIRKIAEPIPSDSSKGAVFGAIEAASAPAARAPFLIENREESVKPQGGNVAVMPTDGSHIPEKLNMDLFYVENDPATKQTIAYVILKGGPEQTTRAERLTLTCKNFIELDSEIRRLHAQLDEIRHQAKKKFYKAQAASA
jgi:hypothetical protein